MVLFDNVMKNPDKVGHGWQGFYFAENGEHRWLDISNAVGDLSRHRVCHGHKHWIAAKRVLRLASRAPSATGSRTGTMHC